MVPRRLLVSFFILSLAGAAAADEGKPPRLRGRVVDRVDGTSGEVIVIHGRPPKPAEPAKPKGYSPIKAPPYSDRAISSNAWTRAWLLLDIDETGRVRRFKYIKRPGHGLEKIAAREAFKLRFEPARNRANQPIGTWIIWLIEWPSYWWLVDTFGTASRMPIWVTTDRNRGNSAAPRSLANSVPCAGSGPLWFASMRALPGGSTRLDGRGGLTDESPMSSSSLRVYRDCSKPDLSGNFDAEPWIVSDR